MRVETSNKMHFTSLGCARNLVDTEVMLGLVLKAGFEVVQDHTQADYLVVNTCGFLEASRDEAYEVIDELLNERKEGAKLIIAGCMVGLHREQLKEQFPEIHFFIGAGDVEKILQAIEAHEPGESVSSNKSYLEAGEIPRQVSTPRHYAYLKIAEGCRKQCAFCIIPKIKGKLQSKSYEQVLKEFRILRKNGAKEIILIAQDLGDFGKDRKERNGLEHLLEMISAEEGDFWLRLLYLYPDEITPGVIQTIKADRRICPYLDMPIQHINDEVLKRMHRKTCRNDIVTTLNRLRDEIPEIVVRTSLMVGFPGETDSQFEELVSFVKEFGLDNVGIFQYSKEEESYSARYEDQIPEEIKQARFERLASAQAEVHERRQSRFVGKKLKVLVEDHHPESDLLLTGRFYGQCPDIDGVVILNDWEAVDRFGEFYEVEITEAVGYDLVGRVLRPLYERKLVCLN
ncbi:MAG: Ribosomal protein S12 methylthiotransferase RimO [Chlamydiia bacterium]|nr:Ribosomal protein S12 methylthiotransferase RimO [Chlamydiia bacterium]